MRFLKSFLELVGHGTNVTVAIMDRQISGSCGVREADTCCHPS
jgi:hypothetical protein